MNRKFFTKKCLLGDMFTILCLILATFTLNQALASDRPILYLFWGKGCPHCEEEQEFLKLLRQRYPELEMRWFEVWDHPEFAELADTLRKAYHEKIASVPLTFLGDQVMLGFQSFETTGAQIETQVKACLQKGCVDALDKIPSQPSVKKIRDEAARNKPDGWELYPAVSPPRKQEKS